MAENQDNLPQDPGRRKFLSQGAAALLGIMISGSVISTLESCGDKKHKQVEDDSEKSNLPLKQKPIQLGYQKIVDDKDVEMLNFPTNKWGDFARVARCLRWKPVTDAVEDRYHIPRGLLMAMMAQEGMGDPTMPNLAWGTHRYGDGGLGLIHIQAVNAHDFGLNTLPRFTRAMCDDEHAKIVVETLQANRNNLPVLVEKDDRFHPIMAVDCAARFLMDCKRKAGNGTDSWMLALQRYSGRTYGGKRGYGFNVVQYRAAINDVTGDGFPKGFSKSVNKDIDHAQKKQMYIKNKLEGLKFTIDGHEAGYQEYLAYFEESMKNFELEKYVALGDSIPSASKQDVAKLPEKTQEKIKNPETTKSNSLIKEEFVNTRQHNSEGFTLYRYKVKAGDTALKLSDKFDDRDRIHGNKYKNTGNLNIVNFKGEKVKNLMPGDVVYIKAK